MKQWARTKSRGRPVAELFWEWERLVADGRADEAEKRCRAAVTQFPDSAALLLSAAPFVTDVEEKKNLVRCAVILEPDNPEALAMAASSMFHVHALEEASEYLARASALVPAGWEHEVDLLYLGGRIAAIREENSRAEEMLSAAYRAQADLPHCGAAYGEILAINGRYREALTVVETSLQHFPADDWLLSLRRDLLQTLAADTSGG
jgi:tetratricopeptide (TPR) repeat protein